MKESTITLNYITFDTWWDTDATILPELCKEYKVNTFVVDGLDKGKYPTKKDYGCRKFLRYKPKYHNWDIRKAWGSLKFFRQIYKECRKKDATNLFIVGRDAYLVVLLYLFLPKRNSIIATHDYTEHVDSTNDIFEHVYKQFFKKFNRFLLFSELQKKCLLKDRPTASAFSITMPLKNFGTPTHKREDSKITFLFFGFMRDYKRPDLYIKAANAVPAGQARFLMVGKGDESNYKPLIKRPDDFRLDMRRVANEEIPDIFCNADFLVLPYEDSTQSGPSLIAVNYGIPIIASRLPDFERLVTNGSNGYLFPSGDADALANIFKTVIEKGRPDIERMKTNMRKFKAEYIKHNDVLDVFHKMLKK